MTLEDAITAIAASTSLSEADVAGFLACSDEERVALIQAYKDAGRMPSASSWDVVLGILKTCAEVAGLVIPIVGAVNGVYGLGKL